MAENNTKLTKPQLIIGVAVLIIILFFVFSNKPATEQAQNLQEQNKDKCYRKIMDAAERPPKESKRHNGKNKEA